MTGGWRWREDRERKVAMADREGRIAACKDRVLSEARKFAKLMAEFDGDVACCDVSMTALLDATDRLIALEREGEG